jgi:UDP-glucose 4-epimerase
MLNKQHVLIIGGSSFVAQNFIRLLQDNYVIKTVSRTSTGFNNELVFQDLSSLSSEVFQGIDVVINCAAIVHQQKEVETSVYNKINFELAVGLAEKAKQVGVKTFIQLSTIAVYGKLTHVTENSAENPVNAYGKSKLLADNSLKKMVDSNFNIIIFRPPMVYGSTNAPGNMMRLISFIAKGLPLPFKGLQNKRDFIHIDNLIGFIDASIKKNSSGVFLVSDNSPVFISELYTVIVKCLEKPNRAFKLPTICFKVLKKIVPGIYDKLFGNLTIDISSTLLVLDFKPVNLLQQGIKEMVENLKTK